MAKGRKLTASWSERLLGSYSYSNSDSHGRIAGCESELGEDDVWSTVDGMANDRRRGVDSSESGEWSPRAGSESGGSFDNFRSRRHRPRVPRTEHHRLDDGSSLTFEDLGETTPSGVVHQFRGQHDGVTAAPTNVRHLSTSVPVNIPNWSNFNRVDSVESFYDSDSHTHNRDFEMVPPHEYLAREYGRTSANSMCEGAGRTLKGRDMSRVRDAVWSQTGFNG
ncbi:PREDICTED: uncharacterized protein LOC109165063 [Ipomoea nil]|uniref:uncharacterized protein LOC109165063 n=1 Tax=Ipomoea nil TaxID=35883 RepID=UPI0009015A65|nr:PREDICTED: uncharacterized protein LOC109165063 [Ipomoea nil]